MNQATNRETQRRTGARIAIATPAVHQPVPDERGRFGAYGGRFVPETLVPALEELTEAYGKSRHDAGFQAELNRLLATYVGRPTPLTLAGRFSAHAGGARIYLKREDLAHGGAHKINNAIAQGLLARWMGKRRVVAETGAGQHGVATAMAAALFNLECVVYMGSEDIRRQAPNVQRMKLLGADVRAVDSGSRTLKDAINEAIRDWVTNVRDTHYLLGSVVGPHPYPMMVRDYQAVIGDEARSQILAMQGRLPDVLVACVGGGSNAMGLFHAFRDDSVRMIGVEAGGMGIDSGRHAARFADPERGRPGVLQGAQSLVLQDADGQILPTHSISAGLDHASVGPEHVYLRDLGRAEYTYATDDEALAAFHLLCRLEGIIPALESSHALAAALRLAPELPPDGVILVNLSGRGDKDLQTVLEAASAAEAARPAPNGDYVVRSAGEAHPALEPAPPYRASGVSPASPSATIPGPRSAGASPASPSTTIPGPRSASEAHPALEPAPPYRASGVSPASPSATIPGPHSAGASPATPSATIPGPRSAGVSPASPSTTIPGPRSADVSPASPSATVPGPRSAGASPASPSATTPDSLPPGLPRAGRAGWLAGQEAGRSLPGPQGGRIAAMFLRTKDDGRAALLPYLMLGFPDPETSLAAARAMLEAGADGLELGIPFSDPLADGKTIQHAGEIALRQGMTIARALDLVARLRRANQTAPLFLMGYLNPLLAYGLERLCRDAALAGIDGLIVPDLPPEEEGPLAGTAEAGGLAIIHLLAPTSSPERIRSVAARSQPAQPALPALGSPGGMLYLVSLTGVTGARRDLPPQLPEFVQSVRAATDLPLAVGFGIATAEQAGAVGRLADAVIVGSAFVERLGRDGVASAVDLMTDMQAAIRESCA